MQFVRPRECNCRAWKFAPAGVSVCCFVCGEGVGDHYPAHRQRINAVVFAVALWTIILRVLVIDNYSGRLARQTLPSRLIEWEGAISSNSTPVSLSRVCIKFCHACPEHIPWPLVYYGYKPIKQLVVLVRPSAVAALDRALCSVVVEAFLGGRTPIGILSVSAKNAPGTTRDARINNWWDFLASRFSSVDVCQDKPRQITVQDIEGCQQGQHSNHHHPRLHYFFRDNFKF